VSVRNLRQIRLWEYSAVPFGMNPATSTVSAKQADIDDLTAFLADATMEQRADLWQAWVHMKAQELLDKDAEPPRYVGADDDKDQDSDQDKIASRPIQCKAINLQQQLHQIASSFYSTFQDSAEKEHWIQEIWDEFLVVETDTQEGATFWKVPYTSMGDPPVPVFAGEMHWQPIEQVWVPLGTTESAIKTLAGQPDEAGPNDDEPLTPEAKGAEPDDSSPTEDELLAEIEEWITWGTEELSEG
jgi:hypothetical protein